MQVLPWVAGAFPRVVTWFVFTVLGILVLYSIVFTVLGIVVLLNSLSAMKDNYCITKPISLLV